ncbi:unnamed protein product [Anisakis simplex]|uniref:C2H2-type domain-containing protein n=1 Tax=Anisakis simplex TaxID=6269 RepID=A0A0M3K683_ANISI|nr:unnamed protein product [Anisakis simplex]
MPVFHTASAFKTHLKEHVGRELKFPMQSNRFRCDMAFANEDARFLHEKEHAKSKSSYVLPDIYRICCVLCGTSSGYWSVPISQLYPPLEHAYIHAFSLWAMCRECGLCFPNEVKKEQFISHYQQTHWLSSSSRCAVCDIPLAGQHVHSHALKRHFVSARNKDRSQQTVCCHGKRIAAKFISRFCGIA